MDNDRPHWSLTALILRQLLAPHQYLPCALALPGRSLRHRHSRDRVRALEKYHRGLEDSLCSSSVNLPDIVLSPICDTSLDVHLKSPITRAGDMNGGTISH